MSNLKQIVVTDHNEWEGENFSYILNVTDEQLTQIKEGVNDEGEGRYTIKENTNYTKEEVEKINDLSDNGYMDAINFYELCVPDGEFDWYQDIFYKAVGLNRL